MFLYDIALRIYAAGIRLAAGKNEKARLWTEGRKGLFERIEQTIGKDGKIAWFHCASLGEFEQGRPVIEQFRKRYPAYKILVTFFSPSGYEVRKNYDGADYIFYMPIDTHKNARRFIRLVHPEIAVFVKYEFWPNFLKELKANGIKTYVISAIFRPSQLFFKPYGGFYRKILGCFTRLFVQNEESRRLLGTIGVTNVTVSGDTRFDRVHNIAIQNQLSLPVIEKFAGGSRTFIAGSTWEKDDEIVTALALKHRKMKFIIAPHELGEQKIAMLCNILEKGGLKTLRYTRITEKDQPEEAQALIIDTIGILSSVYRYGYCAYIGGGFGAGIHNILEAATFGLPLAFGPNYRNFNEAVELTAAEGARPIRNFEEADEWLTTLENDAALHDRSAEICREYVASHTGACNRILDSNLLADHR